jgi:hypothetical protein
MTGARSGAHRDGPGFGTKIARDYRYDKKVEVVNSAGSG